MAALLLGVVVATPSAVGTTPGAELHPNAVGELDCNGFSPIQQTVKLSGVCTDVRGFPGPGGEYTSYGRFYDNGHYIGHDEPDLTFLSGATGSGNNVTWRETLPADPAALPTVSTPGTDVAHWFELSIAPWFSMALCNGDSYPQLPCVPNSDKNAPACLTVNCPSNSYPGAGSSFLEMQFYPPGDAPFVDSISCNNTQWCASLHINDAECTLFFADCNSHCTEPTNFAFVETNGIPTGPPSPQLADNSTFTPDASTLLMNPGDHLRIHIFDAPAPGVPNAGIPPGHALEVSIDDLTTGQSGFMQASAANGFAQTHISDCNGNLFNYEPEYSTASKRNVIPWAALQTNISTEFEIGHFEACTAVSDPLFDGAGGPADPVYNTCTTPYETASDTGGPETGEAVCYPKGDTHGTLESPPNEVAGCLDDLFQNGDLDFDGTGYYPEWPTGTAATSLYPGSFQQSSPTSAGHTYPQDFFQTDAALSESTCTPSTLSGCALPPPGAPGAFYPYWSKATMARGVCVIEFGNVAHRSGVNDFGKDKQYGTNQASTLGYPEFEGQVMANTCGNTTG